MQKWKSYQDRSGFVFLPVDMDESTLLDITEMGDFFKKFLDPITNEIHDCEEYYKIYKTSIKKYNE